jgi:tripartite-type tricarboxylate transporter receptor subunit TctC
MLGPSRRVAAVAAVGLAALRVSLCGAAAQEAVSFKGKTIIVLVGSDPGGGTDASGRLIALYLRKYLPGEPNIVVQNVPGASGITALNYFVRKQGLRIQ